MRPSPARTAGMLALLAAAFGALAWLVTSGAAQQADLAITRAVQSVRAPWLDALAIGVSALGGTGAVLAFAAIFALRSLLLGWNREALVLFLATFGVPLSDLLKAVFERPRPDANLVHVVAQHRGPSFPSGHAMGSIVLYACLYAVLLREFRRGQRPALAWGLGALVFAVGLTRVYLGVHWTSDVLGGWLAGAFYALAVLILCRLPGDRLG